MFQATSVPVCWLAAHKVASAAVPARHGLDHPTTARILPIMMNWFFGQYEGEDPEQVSRPYLNNLPSVVDIE
jgi:hypothetical protein